MLDLIRESRDHPVTVLDFSESFVSCARAKFPDVRYYCRDILQDSRIPCFDYIIMNGVFTEKQGLSYRRMLSYFQNVIRTLYPRALRGLAFNVMSKAVDWERDDLFHLPLDTLQRFLVREVSRHFVIRNDYGLYEYTTYVYRQS